MIKQTWREGWVERDERVTNLLVRIGIRQFEQLLARHAAFADYCMENGRG